MLRMTRRGLMTLAVAVPLTAAPLISANSPAHGQGFWLGEGLMMVQGDMMDPGRMMGFGGMRSMMEDLGRMMDPGRMMDQGAGGMDEQQMNEMMQRCNEMMQSMADGENGNRPNDQWRDRNP